MYGFVIGLAACSGRKDPELLLAATRVHDLIVREQREILINKLGTDIVWSDRALMERTAEVPSPLDILVGGRSVHDVDMLGFIQTMERRRDEWRPATVGYFGEQQTECEVKDATTRAHVNCAYTAYLTAHHPTGRFLVLGEVDPILFLVGDQLQAALMPLAPPVP